MRKYVTISVLREVKELLEKEKGDRDWSSYLLDLFNSVKELRARVAFEELRRILDEKDLEEIIRSSKDFRERFKLRYFNSIIDHLFYANDYSVSSLARD